MSADIAQEYLDCRSRVIQAIRCVSDLDALDLRMVLDDIARAEKLAVEVETPRRGRAPRPVFERERRLFLEILDLRQRLDAAGVIVRPEVVAA